MVKTLRFHCRGRGVGGAWVRSLVGELRSHMLRGQKKKGAKDKGDFIQKSSEEEGRQADAPPPTPIKSESTSSCRFSLLRALGAGREGWMTGG